MSIHVEDAGILSTIQDLGRPGLGVEGVSRAGAADALALRIGNRLLGNPEGAPAIEMTLKGAALRFPEGAVVAWTGAQAGAMEEYTAVSVPAGGGIEARPFRKGARAYLCVRGGLDVQRTAGSASVHLPSGFGGRPLRKGDVLPIGSETGPERRTAVPSPLRRYSRLLRVTAGPQAGDFPGGIPQGAVYTVLAASNRMGIRFEGPAIRYAGSEMFTEGVALGAVQVTPDGRPILLFVDHQTTGGYPKVANVITADLPSAGQLRPGDLVRFQSVDLETALDVLRRQEALLRLI